MLQTAKGGGSMAADSWTYDPLRTEAGEEDQADDAASLTSQRSAFNLFGEGAIYHSEGFPAATEIGGFVKLTLWLTMDVPDTDLGVELWELLPDGNAAFLSNATMRTRYRDSLRAEKLVTPGNPEKCVFDNFQFFSRQIAKGSRLRLIVASLNTPSTEKNYNSGGVVAKETGKDAKSAHIQLLHDAEHPSMLELPIVK
jgi:putative CocE/NonD family hydrolase